MQISALLTARRAGGLFGRVKTVVRRLVKVFILVTGVITIRRLRNAVLVFGVVGKSVTIIALFIYGRTRAVKLSFMGSNGNFKGRGAIFRELLSSPKTRNRSSRA